MFYCVNLRKKNCNLNYDSDSKVLSLNDDSLTVNRLYSVQATQSSEHAYLMAHLGTPYQNKKTLLFRSDSWLVNDDDDADDHVLVEQLNTKMETLSGPDCVLLTDCVEARLHGTTSMNDLYPTKTRLVAPKTLYMEDASNIDVIFCERVTSYTKSFDMVLVMKTGKTVTHSCISRKKINMFVEWAKQNNLEFYQTGPDPLPWSAVMKRHADGESWEAIYKLITHVSDDEDEVSEWSEGNTDPEDEEEDLDFLEDESEEEEEFVEDDFSESDEEGDYEPDAKRRKT